MATVTKETKKKIRVDYEGKLTFKEKLKSKLRASNTWIRAVINVFRFILMLGVSYVILYPFFSRIAGSFMSRADVVDSTVSLIPKNFTLDIYKYIILDNHYLDALWNTFLVALMCALVQTLIACLVGYGLAKFKFKGNTFVMALVIISMVIPHNALTIAMGQHLINFDLFTVKTWGMKGLFEVLFGSPIDLINTPVPLLLLSLIQMFHHRIGVVFFFQLADLITEISCVLEFKNFSRLPHLIGKPFNFGFTLNSRHFRYRLILFNLGTDFDYIPYIFGNGFGNNTHFFVIGLLNFSASQRFGYCPFH